MCSIRKQYQGLRRLTTTYPLSNLEALNTAFPEVNSQKNDITVLLRHEQSNKRQPDTRGRRNTTEEIVQMSRELTHGRVSTDGPSKALNTSTFSRSWGVVVPVVELSSPKPFVPTQTTLMPGGGFHFVVRVRLFQRWVLPLSSQSCTHSIGVDLQRAPTFALLGGRGKVRKTLQKTHPQHQESERG